MYVAKIVCLYGSVIFSPNKNKFPNKELNHKHAIQSICPVSLELQTWAWPLNL